MDCRSTGEEASAARSAVPDTGTGTEPFWCHYSGLCFTLDTEMTKSPAESKTYLSLDPARRFPLKDVQHIDGPRKANCVDRPVYVGVLAPGCRFPWRLSATWIAFGDQILDTRSPCAVVE